MFWAFVSNLTLNNTYINNIKYYGKTLNILLMIIKIIK